MEGRGESGGERKATLGWRGGGEGAGKGDKGWGGMGRQQLSRQPG